MQEQFLRAQRWRLAVAAIVVLLSCLRCAHIHLLWADEDYHVAAALQILHGKVPYRDFWYDKPPLSALYYALIGAHAGWLLRLQDVAYVLLACYLTYRFARTWWGEAEGWAAALLMAFFTTFYLPSAIIPFAADALMIVPHLAAVSCAARKRPFGAGIWTGIAFLVNAKALFVLVVCAVWLWPAWGLLAAGFAVPTLAALLSALFCGAWPGYIEQVWRWGLLYARGSPVVHPFWLGIVSTTHWLGFHSALLIGAAFGIFASSREQHRKLTCWLLLSFAAVCLGTRFAPHYFLQFLPAMVIVASRGVVTALRDFRKPAMLVLAVTLLVPFIRFAPRYASLTYDDLMHRDPQWIDVVLDLDSQDVARRIRHLARPSDTLFVWGYRPDIYVYTRTIAAGLFWDSQPLTGVPADRHLHATTAIYGGPAAADREELIRTHPPFLVDGLSLLNPKLDPSIYPELRPWLAEYALVNRTKLSLIYERRDYVRSFNSQPR
ncbi:MAG: hypothetical protein JO091_01445 [Acidobacteriaceae bacterium]|nr:hypothetical protein [Acidobacteriaceae bacterium]